MRIGRSSGAYDSVGPRVPIGRGRFVSVVGESDEGIDSLDFEHVIRVSVRGR
jgi:hypothetical protein